MFLCNCAQEKISASIDKLTHRHGNTVSCRNTRSSTSALCAMPPRAAFPPISHRAAAEKLAAVGPQVT